MLERKLRDDPEILPFQDWLTDQKLTSNVLKLEQQALLYVLRKTPNRILIETSEFGDSSQAHLVKGLPICSRNLQNFMRNL